MTYVSSIRRSAVLLLILHFLSAVAGADEGLWLLDHPPLAELKQRYQFEPPPGWLDHEQKSAVNFGGASGSLVSADGLVLTNHHVGSAALSKLSSAGHDLLKDGFYAATRDAELKCPDLELKVLWSIEDVTEKVNSAVTAGMSLAEANTARRKTIITIEKQSEDQTGLLSRVVTLYHGARYHLYQSKRFTDVRLVFAPEQGIAFYGGDTDNFEFPRFDLDICVFRIYENDKPLHPEHFLKWSPGAAEGDLAFVFGHPGRTQRLNTVDHLKFIRDVSLPDRLASAWRRQAQLAAFSGRDDEHARISARETFGVQNSRKAMTGQLAALQDPAFLSRKADAERTLMNFVQADPKRTKDWGNAWEGLRDAFRQERIHFTREQVVGRVVGHSEMASIALDLVRLSDELKKPDSDRLPEYSDAHLKSLMLYLYSPAPIYDALEIEQLASDLSYAATALGADDPLVVQMLAGKSPLERAEQLIAATRLKDVAERRRISDGGKPEIEKSEDAMIRFAAAIDPVARAERKRFEDQTESAEKDSYARIAAAAFAAEGEKVYPDATGTLRIAYGTIKGYQEHGGDITPFTTIGGLYERAARHKDQAGFAVPATWADAKAGLNLSTPFNFVLTADIIGGNSGSPVVNRAGELIGLIFDGNLQSLAWDFSYDDRLGRAVAVDGRAMIEALHGVYHADALVEELTHH